MQILYESIQNCAMCAMERETSSIIEHKYS